MKSRVFASLALGGIVLLSATGCSNLTQQATTLHVNPSDGVSIASQESDTVVLRNVFIVADQDGAEGNLVAGIVNSGDDDSTVTVDWTGGTATVDVPANSTVSLGGEDEPLLLESLDAKPGSTTEVYFQAADQDGASAEIPVLDNCLTEYADLAPTDSPTSRATCDPQSFVEDEHE
ncbi:hypothetical protein [Microbacterium indicum]|uniref:hypothetical protein n=1 Tax=Microbacterium indicum TaxID=358100 RepID=UPI0006879374|nr:hypothetical protein [Microbacterium indicum]